MNSHGRRDPVRGFRRLNKLEPSVNVLVDGRPLLAEPNDTVATLLLASGIDCFQSNKPSAAPRGPYCMMGVCFECLVTVDGLPDVQACMTPVRDGMRVVRPLRKDEP